MTKGTTATTITGLTVASICAEEMAVCPTAASVPSATGSTGEAQHRPNRVRKAALTKRAAEGSQGAPGAHMTLADFPLSAASLPRLHPHLNTNGSARPLPGHARCVLSPAPLTL